MLSAPRPQAGAGCYVESVAVTVSGDRQMARFDLFCAFAACRAVERRAVRESCTVPAVMMRLLAGEGVNRPAGGKLSAKIRAD